MSAIPKYVLDRTRDLIGARGYVRLLNDEPAHRKLKRLVELAEQGGFDRRTVEEAFEDASKQRGDLDDVIRLLESPRRPTMRPTSHASRTRDDAGRSDRGAAVRPEQARPTAAPSKAGELAAAANAARIPAIEMRVAHLADALMESRAQARDMETLVRELVERAVLDAARIQALEGVVLAMADGSGIGADARAVHADAFARFLRERVCLTA